jgi:hypothetical protein
MKKEILILLSVLVFLAPVTFYLNNVSAQENKNSTPFYEVKKQEVKENKIPYRSTVFPNGPKVVRTSVASGLWSNPATWGGTVPLPGDDVVITTFFVTFDSLASPATIGNLTISNNSGTLSDTGKTILTVIGNTSIRGNLIMKNGTSTESTWLYVKGDFLIRTGGTFNQNGNNTKFDFIGTANQTFTNYGTVSSPMRDFTCENPVSVTIVDTNIVTHPINLREVYLISGSIINSNLLNIGNGAINPIIQRGGNATANAGSFAQSPVFNLGTGNLKLIYDNSLSAINTGFEIPASDTISNMSFLNSPTVLLSTNLAVTTNIDWSGNPTPFLGTFDLNGLTLTIGGTFTRAGAANGNLNGGGNSFITCTNPTPTSIPSVSTGGLSTLTINGAGGISLTGNVTVQNILTLNGNLSIGNNVLRINGNIVQSGGTLTGGSTSKLNLNGSGNLILPNIISGQLHTLTVSRGVNNKITLGGDLQVLNTLDFQNGNIITGAFTLTLGMADTSVGTLNYTAGANSGVIVGKFARWFSAGINPTPVLFPVGDVNTNSSPRMLTIQYTSAPTTGGTLTAQYITGDPGNNNPGSMLDGSYTVDTYSSTGYWQVDAAAITGGNYSVSISPIGFLGILNPAELRVLKRPDALSLWTLDGTHVPGTPTPLAAIRSGLSSFSQFALGGNLVDNPLDGVLPVELSSFSSSINVNNVKLTWITASEKNNLGFEIYRKSEQTNWNKIGFVSGSGTVNTPKTYSYNDNGLSAGKYSYELKQIDFNGNFEFFVMPGITEIGVPKKFEVSQNYPNPFNPVTKIDYQLPEAGKIKIVIYDMLGREIKNLVNEVKPAGFYSAEFDASSLASGIYIYRLSLESSNNNFIITKKMSLIK